jgi:DNA primase
MPGIDYRQLRQLVSMTEVLELIGFRATRRKGSQLRGLCPIPGCPSASDPDFSVEVDRQIYQCFACHCQGNALDLWAAVRRLPLHQAAVDLCQRAALPLPRFDPTLMPMPRSSRRVPSRAPSRNH